MAARRGRVLRRGRSTSSSWYQGVSWREQLADHGPVRARWSSAVRLRCGSGCRPRSTPASSGLSGERLPAAVHPRGSLPAGGRTRRGVRPRAGRRDATLAREAAHRARRRPPHQRDAVRRADGLVGSRATATCRCAQPVGQRRPLGAAPRIFLRTSEFSGGEGHTARDRRGGRTVRPDDPPTSTDFCARSSRRRCWSGSRRPASGSPALSTR
ncbi:hypothetical protein HBB16_19080 [Pseudonocardia sp. MCCB 268]|nr:hypothetical protein [Pseudonocardia cytotoxica]